MWNQKQVCWVVSLPLRFWVGVCSFSEVKKQEGIIEMGERWEKMG